MRGRARMLVGISLMWLPLSLVSDGLNTLALPHVLQGMVDEGMKATGLGLLTFAGLAASMLLQPIAGGYSDRLRSRWGRLGTIAAGVALVLVSLVVFGLGRDVLAISMGYLLVLLSVSVAQAGQQGFIPDLVPPKRRGFAAGLKGFMDIGGALLGFILLAGLLESGRTEMALASMATLLVAAFLFTALLVREPPVDVRPDAGRFAPWHAFHLDLRRHQVFAWAVASRFLFLVGTYAVGRFFLYFVGDRLGLGANEAAGEAGMLLAGLTLITVVITPVAGWTADRWGRRPSMLLGAALSAIGVALLIFARDPGQIFLFGALMSVGSAAFTAANWALAADLVPPEEAGRFMGLANVGTAGAAAAAGLLGPLIDWANGPGGAGYSALFAASSLLFLGSAWILRYVPPEAGAPHVPGPGRGFDETVVGRD